jgi:hypothetical protein
MSAQDDFHQQWRQLGLPLPRGEAPDMQYSTAYAAWLAAAAQRHVSEILREIYPSDEGEWDEWFNATKARQHRVTR